MSFSVKRRLYEDSPDWLKHPLGWVPFSWVAGSEYRRVLQEGSAIDVLGREEVRAFQERRLGRILAFACEYVPAYQAFRSVVDRLRPFEALKAFPFVSKMELQSEYQRFLPRHIDVLPHWQCTTGGTSGNQLQFFLDDASHGRELAFIHRLWSRVGYKTRYRKATFRGTPFREMKRGVFWRRNPIYNELLFSPFHMSEGNLGAYVDELLRFRPEFLHGYPSAIQLLADYVIRHGVVLKGLHLRAVLLGSEGLEAGQRAHLQRAFGCRIFSWYGHSERVILGGECENTDVYHHFPDYGVLEIVDSAGTPLAEDGARGELVGTGLLNHSLPLIRYRTEDSAIYRHQECACGRMFDRFDEVEGRWRQEYVIGKTGARISPSALNLHGPLLEKVVRYQYYQDEPGIMALRLMVTDGFSPHHVQALIRAYSDKVGSELEVRPQIVADIPLTAAGKLRRLVQKLDAERKANEPE
jgi:phenylacetate-CoA ligase